MALYIFNCSVDTPDFNTNTVPENLHVNDQESIIEIVTEKLLGFENAIPEHDDADCEDSSLKKNFTLDVFTVSPVAIEIPKSSLSDNRTNNAYSERFSDVTRQQHFPPPEV